LMLVGHNLAILEEIWCDAPVATPWHKSGARTLLKCDVKRWKNLQLWLIKLYQSEAAHCKFKGFSQSHVPRMR